MKLAIIADDLTGANDSGVQLSRNGMKTTVLFDMDESRIGSYEAVAFDTDSRSVKADEAYRRVNAAARFLLDAGFRNIFKKVDSTMRGNIGAEIDALYDALKPDFVMFAPGYPKNNRTVLDSMLYLDGVPVGETEIAKDPKTPVTLSYLPDLLGKQTKRSIGTLTADDLVRGRAHIWSKLEQYRRDEVTYLVIDSTEERQLEQILADVKKAPYRLAWAGSAGLANYLPAYYELPSKPQRLEIEINRGPVLTVIGSVNRNSRAQLRHLLDGADVHAIPFESWKAVASGGEQEREIGRVYREALEAAERGRDVVIYSTGSPEHIEEAWRVGEAAGLDRTEISNEIVKALGAVCAPLLEENRFKGVSMSGGDTAKQICLRWGIKGFELLDELEIGVPISTFLGKEDLYVITKAGGFGTDRVFIHAMERLKGEN
ncbi:four-carbon acid sugar kinase family protein [Saccharibacillus sp. CPCC 101409]|uniref:four-carbon acid sugar kinase family protein n=1 Tax=Saccharibacillus sp. CPCC 101409 TaxID=3058041 RepID=UPI002673B7EB|nr:four-carbon acid sugar kinase family protein [Saccharibacillus sp. CPCC 101409]MDO3412325.1 four-carbon acid sugar kinase family protein [Saccharibacillus sp. CPCC 101409]